MSAGAGNQYWKNCNICKKEIPFSSTYYLCTVSTCRAKRTLLVFCSELCWDGHLGFARHRDPGYEEAEAPGKEAYLREIQAENSGKPERSR